MNRFSYTKLDIPLSTGIKYDNIHTVDIRGFVLKELRNISSTNVDEWTIQDIVSYYKDIIIPRDKDDNPISLNNLIEDDLYILMFFVNTLTNRQHKKTFMSRCPECDEINSVQLSIGDYKFSKINGALEIPIIKDNYEIKIIRNKVSDIINKKTYYNKYEKFYDRSTIDLAFNIRVIRYEFMDDISILKDKLKLDRYTEVDEELIKSLVFLDNIEIDDLEEIIEVIDSIKIKVEPFEVECTECKNKYITVVQLKQKDYLPKNEFKKYNRLRTYFSGEDEV